MAKFIANNNESASTKFSPFLTFKSLYLRRSFNIIDLFDISICKWIYKQETLNISKNIENTWEFAWKAIASI